MVWPKLPKEAAAIPFFSSIEIQLKENAAQIKAAGANVLVAGSSVFSKADKRRAIENLRTK